jgi:hypothetical protein
MADGRHPRWLFTINNPTEDDRTRILQLYEDDSFTKTLYTATETAPTTGTQHIHGYLETANRHGKSLRQLTIKIPRAHWEIARGTQQQNYDYITKNGPPDFNKNIRNHAEQQWTRDMKNVYQQLVEAINSSANPHEIATQFPRPWIQYGSRIDFLITQNAGKHARTYDGELQHKNIWISGPPGVGKSRWAHKQFPTWQTLHKDINKWWNGYRPEDIKIVLIEEWDPTHACLASKLKLWSDRYPFPGEIKNSSLVIEPLFFLVITSNYTIEQCFPNYEDQKSIKRRFAQWQIETPEDIRLTTTLDYKTTINSQDDDLHTSEQQSQQNYDYSSSIEPQTEEFSE